MGGNTGYARLLLWLNFSYHYELLIMKCGLSRAHGVTSESDISIQIVTSATVMSYLLLCDLCLLISSIGF